MRKTLLCFLLLAGCAAQPPQGSALDRIQKVARRHEGHGLVALADLLHELVAAEADGGAAAKQQAANVHGYSGLMPAVFTAFP